MSNSAVAHSIRPTTHGRVMGAIAPIVPFRNTANTVGVIDVSRIYAQKFTEDDADGYFTLDEITQKINPDTGKPFENREEFNEYRAKLAKAAKLAKKEKGTGGGKSKAAPKPKSNIRSSPAKRRRAYKV